MSATIKEMKRTTNRELVLAVSPKVTPHQIADALAHIGKSTGCSPCGLLGWDIRIAVVDPTPFQKELTGLPGIEGAVSF